MKKTVKANPFLREGKIPVLSRAGGNLYDAINPFFIEAEPKSYLYHERLAPIIPLLSPGGLRLLLYITMRLRWNVDTVHLDRKAYLKWSGSTSIQSFYNARADLQEHGIIAPAGGPTYWINPFVIFRGNRVVYGRDHEILEVVKSNKQTLTDDGTPEDTAPQLTER